MIKLTITYKVTVKWWLPIYLKTLIFICYIVDSEPDYDKLTKIIMKGIDLRIVENKSKSL